jgi:hypothetical protein
MQDELKRQLIARNNWAPPSEVIFPLLHAYILRDDGHLFHVCVCVCVCTRIDAPLK